MKLFIYALPLAFLMSACFPNSGESEELKSEAPAQLSREVPSLVILGTVQDGGSPHIACKKECCQRLFDHPDPNRKVVSLGLVDPISKEQYIFEASPDFPQQLEMLSRLCPFRSMKSPQGIFLSHAHIGHYTGLMYLGREAQGAQKVPVYAMPRMQQFLSSNGPWSQLVTLKNIELREILDQESLRLNAQLSVIPLIVPHRDEFSETVGFKIMGPNKKVLFIPDIDKWGKWQSDILEQIKQVDYAFLDATFFDAKEINNRDITEIPHPFVIESLQIFKNLAPSEKAKIHFIHFNHTNPLLHPNSEASAQVESLGFHIARLGMRFEL